MNVTSTSIIPSDDNQNNDYNTSNDLSNNDFSNNDISTLSDAQKMTLGIAPIIPSLLSVLGSSLIIYMIWKSKKFTPYRRLMLGMSICDIIFSITIPSWIFLLPSNTSQHIWAFGNDTTCSITGFTYQFSFSSVIYNGMLSYYFLLVVRFGWREEQISKCIEPMMHIISVGFPIITATIGMILGVYHETKLIPGCWIANFPENCGNIELGKSGEKCSTKVTAWIFAGIPITFLLASLTINNILIYLHVQNTIQRVRSRYSFSITRQRRRRRQRRQQQRDSQTRRIRAVATQAFLYVGGCIMTNFCSVLVRNIEGIETLGRSFDSRIFVLLVGCAIFAPIQGFLNLLVFIRPKYMTTRSDFPKETIIWCFWRALLGESVKPKRTSSGNSGGIQQQQQQRQQQREQQQQQQQQGRHDQRRQRMMYATHNNNRINDSFIMNSEMFTLGGGGGRSSEFFVSPRDFASQEFLSREFASRDFVSREFTSGVLTVAVPNPPEICERTRSSSEHITVQEDQSAAAVEKQKDDVVCCDCSDYPIASVGSLPEGGGNDRSSSSSSYCEGEIIEA